MNRRFMMLDYDSRMPQVRALLRELPFMPPRHLLDVIEQRLRAGAVLELQVNDRMFRLNGDSITCLTTSSTTSAAT